jgi:hypothetical protein
LAPTHAVAILDIGLIQTDMPAMVHYSYSIHTLLITCMGVLCV